MIRDRENIFKVLMILAGILASLYILSPFIPVILLSAVVAFALSPLVQKIRRSHWCGQSASIYALTFGLFLVIAVPFFAILAKFYEKFLALDLAGKGQKTALENFNKNREQLLESLNKTLSQFGLRKAVNVEAMINDVTHQIFTGILQASTYVIKQIPSILFSFAVFLAALFLFMRHSSRIRRAFYSARLMNVRETRMVIRILKETSYSAIFSSIITGLLQASIVTAGSMVFLDVDHFLVFIVTFFCSFIPVIGAAPIAFVLAIYAWTKGNARSAVGLIVVASIAGVADNVIRVFLIKFVKDKLHPFWALLAIIGGILVFGLSGLFLGPVIVSATQQIVQALLSRPSLPIHRGSSQKGDQGLRAE